MQQQDSSLRGWIAGGVLLTFVTGVLPVSPVSIHTALAATPSPWLTEATPDMLPDRGQLTLESSLFDASPALRSSVVFESIINAEKSRAKKKPIYENIQVTLSAEPVKYMLTLAKFTQERLLADFYTHLDYGEEVFGESVRQYRRDLRGYVDNLRLAFPADKFPDFQFFLNRLALPNAFDDAEKKDRLELSKETNPAMAENISIDLMRRALLLWDFNWHLRGMRGDANSPLNADREHGALLEKTLQASQQDLMRHGSNRILCAVVDLEFIRSFLKYRVDWPIFRLILDRVLEYRKVPSDGQQEIYVETRFADVLVAYAYYSFMRAQPTFARIFDIRGVSLDESHSLTVANVLRDFAPSDISFYLQRTKQAGDSKRPEAAMLTTVADLHQGIWNQTAVYFRSALAGMANRSDKGSNAGFYNTVQSVAFKAGTQPTTTAVTDPMVLTKDNVVEPENSASIIEHYVDLIPIFYATPRLLTYIALRWGIPVETQRRHLDALMNYYHRYYEEMRQNQALVRYLIVGSAISGVILTGAAQLAFVPILLFAYDSILTTTASLTAYYDAVGKIPALYEALYYHPSNVEVMGIDPTMVESHIRNVAEAENNLLANLGLLSAEALLLTPLAMIATDFRANRALRAKKGAQTAKWLETRQDYEGAADLRASLNEVDSRFNPAYVRARTQRLFEQMGFYNRYTLVTTLLRRFSSFVGRIKARWELFLQKGDELLALLEQRQTLIKQVGENSSEGLAAINGKLFNWMDEFADKFPRQYNRTEEAWRKLSKAERQGWQDRYNYFAQQVRSAKEGGNLLPDGFAEALSQNVAPAELADLAARLGVPSNQTVTVLGFAEIELSSISKYRRLADRRLLTHPDMLIEARREINQWSASADALTDDEGALAGLRQLADDPALIRQWIGLVERSGGEEGMAIAKVFRDRRAMRDLRRFTEDLGIGVKQQKALEKIAREVNYSETMIGENVHLFTDSRNYSIWDFSGNPRRGSKPMLWVMRKSGDVADILSGGRAGRMNDLLTRIQAGDVGGVSALTKLQPSNYRIWRIAARRLGAKMRPVDEFVEGIYKARTGQSSHWGSAKMQLAALGIFGTAGEIQSRGGNFWRESDEVVLNMGYTGAEVLILTPVFRGYMPKGGTTLGGNITFALLFAGPITGLRNWLRNGFEFSDSAVLNTRSRMVAYPTYATLFSGPKKVGVQALQNINNAYLGKNGFGWMSNFALEGLNRWSGSYAWSGLTQEGGWIDQGTAEATAYFDAVKNDQDIIIITKSHGIADPAHCIGNLAGDTIHLFDSEQQRQDGVLPDEVAEFLAMHPSEFHAIAGHDNLPINDAVVSKKTLDACQNGTPVEELLAKASADAAQMPESENPNAVPNDNLLASLSQSAELIRDEEHRLPNGRTVAMMDFVWDGDGKQIEALNEKEWQAWFFPLIEKQAFFMNRATKIVKLYRKLTSGALALETVYLLGALGEEAEAPILAFGNRGFKIPRQLKVPYFYSSTPMAIGNKVVNIIDRFYLNLDEDYNALVDNVDRKTAESNSNNLFGHFKKFSDDLSVCMDAKELAGVSSIYRDYVPYDEDWMLGSFSLKQRDQEQDRHGSYYADWSTPTGKRLTPCSTQWALRQNG